MSTISLDLRQRIVDAWDARQATQKQIAERFCVSYAFVKKLLAQRKAIGTIEPQRHRCGRKKAISPEGHERLRRLVLADPGATLEQLRERAGLTCCIKTVHYALRDLGFTYKKQTYRASEQDREDVARRREH